MSIHLSLEYGSQWTTAWDDTGMKLWEEPACVWVITVHYKSVERILENQKSTANEASIANFSMLNCPLFSHMDHNATKKLLFVTFSNNLPSDHPTEIIIPFYHVNIRTP